MADRARYDVVIVGSGPGGAAVAQRLAPTGKQILILERGGWLERSAENWNAAKVFIENAYRADETWYDRRGAAFHPGLHYFVGGNSKVYGAALFRMRERDFEALRHAGGLSPEWPVKYDVFAPYYDEAERLYRVHAAAGEDPTEPPRSGPYPYPPLAHEPRLQALSDALARQGLHPFHMPIGVMLDQGSLLAERQSAFVRNPYFDGYPSPTNGKADAEVVSIVPTLAAHPNVTLRVGARVARLSTDPGGHCVTEIHALCEGAPERYAADIVVLACGALSTALLLLRSADERHPQGLANGSGQVGRNYMRHNQSAMLAVGREPNDTVFQKTLALSDFYFGADDWDCPLGLIQMTGKSHADTLRGEVLPPWLEWLPRMPFDCVARHALDFWLSSEDLPRPENRIRYVRDRVVLEQHDNNMEAHRRLRGKLRGVLARIDASARLLDRRHLLGMRIPIGGTAHQAGTARFGTDPRSSVLDTACKAHELDNLYVADASFFPSISAVNPTLTIVANALRVADGIAERLGALRVREPAQGDGGGDPARAAAAAPEARHA